MSEPIKSFVIVVGASPYTHQAADSALAFAKAVIKKGHAIEQVFFYYDGVYVATRLAAPERSERNIARAWSSFASDNNIDLLVCSNSALKRGMLDHQYARSASRPAHNVDPAFTVAGLGQFVDATTRADRVISFVA